MSALFQPSNLKQNESMSDIKINRATLRSLQELEKVIATFGEYWEKWSTSQYAVLNLKETAIIKHYRAHKTHLKFANDNGLTRRHVSVIYNKSTRKLKLPRTQYLFNKWTVYCRLVDAGAAKAHIDLDSLVEPAGHLELPVDLLLKLHNSISTNEPMHVSEEELLEARPLIGLTSSEKHQYRKSHVCMYLYIIPTPAKNA
jgi:hypothetical protein